MNEQKQKAYVEEKAVELDLFIQGQTGKIPNFKDVQDFILSIIKDCQPKVSKEFVKEWIKIMGCEKYEMKSMFKEVGVEVEK